MSAPFKILFVTVNSNKVAELQRMIANEERLNGRVEIVLRWAKIDEFQGSPIVVAHKKCVLAREQAIKRGIEFDAVLVEDTSLSFRALGGMPGVYVKWFEEAIGLWGLVKLLASYEDKTACARCIFALGRNPPEQNSHDELDGVRTFVGETQGRIVTPRLGTWIDGPFGWDPIFECDIAGKMRTFAEMTKAKKDSVSPRGKALRALIEYLVETTPPIPI